MAKKKREDEMAVAEKTIEKKDILVSTVTTRDMLEIEDRKPVTGIFRFDGRKEGILRLPGMRKYKGEKMDNLTLIHGQTYTIPKWKADWLNGLDYRDEVNNPCKTPGSVRIVHQDQWEDLHKKRLLQEPQRKQNYSFTPVAKW